MNNQPQDLMQLIQSSSPAQIINNAAVGDRFKELYRVIHGIKDAALADAFYIAEKFHFLKLINDSKNLQACTKLSLYGVFMDVAVSGLSFDPTMKHLYLVPYNINVGTRDNPQWEKRAALQISGYGELLLRQMQGQVKYVDNPVVVYDGDEFKYGTRNGQTIVEHMASIPRKSDSIIACYLSITRMDGSRDYKVMTWEDVQALRKFSKDQNSLGWTTGIKGMVEAKTIKHAFKNYPKVRMGEWTRLSTETVDQAVEDVADELINYGFDGVQSMSAFSQPQPQHQLPESQAVPLPAQNIQQPQPAAALQSQQNGTSVELDF